MPEFLRSIVGRLRVYAGDRRHVSRRGTHLLVTVAPEAPSRVNGRRSVPALEGYTRDISPDGLGLIVPAIRIGEHYLAGENCRLLVLLELPSGPVYIHATSVRYERLDEDKNDHGYLIGARITEMSPEHRKRFMSYLEDELNS